MTMERQQRTEILNEEHLRLLSLFYYVRAGTTAFFACIPIIHVGLGIFMIILSHHLPAKPNEPSPAIIGWLFLVIGLFIITLGWLLAVLQFLAGRFIARRQHRTFCLIVAGANCLALPYGTLAGVMTFIVLGRDSVRALFAGGGVAAPGASIPPLPG